MVVTINTDAAYHSGYKVGAFAFWIICDEGKITHSGVLKEVKNATEAEVQCILNAIHVVANSGWKDIKRVVVNTDSTNAIYILTNKKQQINQYRLKWGRKYLDKFAQILSKSEIRKKMFKFQHQPGHKDTATARAWVNSWCDQKAKESLWDLINNKLKPSE